MTGTVFEREAMASKVRLGSAQESVHRFKMQRLGLVGDDVEVADQQGALKARMGMDALVSDDEEARQC